MALFTITNRATGQDLGTYEGATAKHAIAAMHRDAGYMATVIGGELVTDAPGGGAELDAKKAGGK